MEEVQFVIGFTVFAAVLLLVPLFLLGRGLNRKIYLRPVLYGMFFGFGTFVLFIAGIFSFMIGGMVTGYLLAREVRGFFPQFRAGALSGLLMNSSAVIAIAGLLILRGPSQVLFRTATSNDLLSLCFYTGLLLFQNIVLVGASAWLGGLLRKFLAPAQERSQEPAPKSEGQPSTAPGT